MIMLKNTERLKLVKQSCSKVRQVFQDSDPYLEIIYRVSQKKSGICVQGSFEGLNDRKSKSGRKQTPIKIQF